MDDAEAWAREKKAELPVEARWDDPPEVRLRRVMRLAYESGRRRPSLAAQTIRGAINAVYEQEAAAALAATQDAAMEAGRTPQEHEADIADLLKLKALLALKAAGPQPKRRRR